MKKTYIAPAACAATFKTAILMEQSMNVNPGTTPVSGGNGGWTRQMWAEEEEEQ